MLGSESCQLHCFLLNCFYHFSSLCLGYVCVYVFFFLFVFLFFFFVFFFFSSRRRHTRYWRDWSSDVCSSDLRSVARTSSCLTAPRLPCTPIAGSRSSSRPFAKSSRRRDGSAPAMAGAASMGASPQSKRATRRTISPA